MEDRDGKQHVIDELMTLDGTRPQYFGGVRDEAPVDPATYRIDYYYPGPPARKDAVIDLLWDYRADLDAYDEFQRVAG